MKNVLLIDVGNTTVDFRYTSTISSQIIKLERIWTKDEEKQNLDFIISIFDKIENLSKVVFSSVVPIWTNLINQGAEKKRIPVFAIKEHFEHDLNIFQEVNINKLGSDFIANYYGVVDGLKLQDCIVVSMGTATTLFVIENMKFKGAIIAPGIKIALNSLIQNAAMLSQYEFNYTEMTLGTNTKTAIEIGAINGHFKMIKALIEDLQKTKKHQVVITGGNAEIITHQFEQEDYLIKEELIFIGLQSKAFNKKS
ncbi:type III pantothenate kinase [Spiroplasma alleghenense]|uniref:Type III pantothenate kinase n=1 Tax=Spiroplasma alleghenense TaxID=216931 RepID=A0A345Z478_9MOLU|nr:type III pantothenate kinase [Spiroplasma alleghenense]AXK51407.1 type III pantothenate kinase [Spiroplasma alleghenense]